jgi:biotin carboxylase
VSRPKRKLLLAGGGYAEIPLIKAAQALGYHVITSGNRESELGHRYSDECVLADYSDKEAMLRVAEQAGIDAVCACCNDFSALSAAFVAEELGLPGHDPYETAKIIHQKDRYRRFALENGIASPRAQGFGSVSQAMETLEDFDLPVLVKPVDLTGGKGITRIDRLDDARAALETAFQISRAKRVVVEEFIEGSRHGLSTFVRDGKVVFHFSDNEYYYRNPYLVSAASAPGDVPDSAISKLRAASERIVSLLSLKTGIFHIQYILRDTEPVIVEICRRAPGDLYVSFVEHATGIDYSSYIVKASAGLDCGDLAQVDPAGYYTRHCVMTERTGTVQDVSIDPAIEGMIIDDLMWWRRGDQVDDILTHKLGIVFLRFDSMREMTGTTARLPTLIRAEFEA